MNSGERKLHVIGDVNHELSFRWATYRSNKHRINHAHMHYVLILHNIRWQRKANEWIAIPPTWHDKEQGGGAISIIASGLLLFSTSLNGRARNTRRERRAIESLINPSIELINYCLGISISCLSISS